MVSHCATVIASALLDLATHMESFYKSIKPCDAVEYSTTAKGVLGTTPYAKFILQYMILSPICKSVSSPTGRDREQNSMG